MKGEAEMAVPPLFRCPISLDLFKDPVTLCTGQTYDRYCIEKWLSAGNLTCPVTMQKLNDISMVPNHTLSHLIHHWLQSNNQIQQDSTKLAQIEAPFVSMKQVIQSDETTLESKLQVLEKVQDVFQEQPFKNSCLIKLDFFRALVELALTSAARNSLDFHENTVMLLEKSLFCALKLMPFSDMKSLNLLKEEAQFELLVFLLEKGSVPIKKSLCLLVEAISSNLETQELAEKMGNSIKMLTEIVHLVEHNLEAAEPGITAISALSLIKQNQENLVKHGVIQACITHLSNVEKREKYVVTRAISTIENLLSLELAKEAVVNHPSGVSSLVKMVFRVSNHEGSESAVNSLLILCLEFTIAREKAIDAGVLTQLLLLLQSQCHGRTKAKARRLLKCLRSMWNEDSESNHGL